MKRLPSFAPSSAFSLPVIYQRSRPCLASFLARYGVRIHSCHVVRGWLNMQVCLLMGTWGRHKCLSSTLQAVRGAVGRGVHSHAATSCTVYLRTTPSAIKEWRRLFPRLRQDDSAQAWPIGSAGMTLQSRLPGRHAWESDYNRDP
jgi:hypothetical protein